MWSLTFTLVESSISGQFIPVTPICVSEMTPALVWVLKSPRWLLHLHLCLAIHCLSNQKPLRQACVVTSVKAGGGGNSGHEHRPRTQAAWVQIPALLHTTRVALGKQLSLSVPQLGKNSTYCTGFCEDGKS